MKVINIYRSWINSRVNYSYKTQNIFSIVISGKIYWSTRNQGKLLAIFYQQSEIVD